MKCNLLQMINDGEEKKEERKGTHSVRRSSRLFEVRIIKLTKFN